MPGNLPHRFDPGQPDNAPEMLGYVSQPLALACFRATSIGLTRGDMETVVSDLIRLEYDLNKRRDDLDEHEAKALSGLSELSNKLWALGEWLKVIEAERNNERLRWKGGEMVADAESALAAARAGAAYVERYYTHPENRGPLPAA